MNKMMDCKEMENEVDKYFANLTTDKLIADLEAADYSFYGNVTVEFLGGLDTTQVTYGQIKISSLKASFTLPTSSAHSYKKVDFISKTDDYKLAA